MRQENVCGNRWLQRVTERVQHSITRVESYELLKGKHDRCQAHRADPLADSAPAWPGIFFLSGETSLDEDNEEVATVNLSTMNKLFEATMPWRLSFSCGKALQKTRIVTWPGEEENKEAAQKALKAQANANFDAVMGKRGVLQLHQAESGRLMLPMT